MNKNSPQYLLSASYGLIGYLTSSLAEYCAKRREHKLLYIIAGGLHLAIRRALNLKALSEAGWSEFLLTRLWSFSARAKERGKQPRMSTALTICHRIIALCDQAGFVPKIAQMPKFNVERSHSHAGGDNVRFKCNLCSQLPELSVAVQICTLTSFTVVRFYRHRNTGAVHEYDLPGACLFFQEGRFQPFLISGPGGVSDTAAIDVGNPSGVAADVDVGFGYVPLEAFTCCMLSLDEGQDAISAESGASIVDVKVGHNDCVQQCNIVSQGCSEYRLHCVYDLSLVRRKTFLSSCIQKARGKCEGESKGG